MSIELHSAVSGSHFETPSVIVKGSDDYEFSVFEDSVVTTLASRMKVAGVAVITMGIAHTLIAMMLVRQAPTNVASSMITALICSILGALLLSAARQFRAIAETQGDDLSHLMSALGRLSQYFIVQGVLIAGSAALLTFTLVLLAFAPR